jgi:predicted heme/steroid binding protein
MSSYQYSQAKKNSTMSTPSSDLRQRKTTTTTNTTSAAQKLKNEDKSNILLDIARTVVFVLLATTALSYLVTRESFVWGVKRPTWTKVEFIKSWIVPPPIPFPLIPTLLHLSEILYANFWEQNGPTQYTDTDLLSYDGSNPDLPILLAINGTIYDVSAGRKHYGPGGSYHFFAGRDASRAFVTNCFQEDGTPDMRGVEEMFIPIDNEEVDSLYGKGELKVVKEVERRAAKKEVDKALRHWLVFLLSCFYFEVAA